MHLISDKRVCMERVQAIVTKVGGKFMLASICFYFDYLSKQNSTYAQINIQICRILALKYVSYCK